MVSLHSSSTLCTWLISSSRDQELRFTVHDSADYYQLKLSVFNDDKKTDIIGETWIQLMDIIKPGGGQSDMWHNLNFKGKYAGELRMELTYYDSRPKDEMAAETSSILSSSSQQDSGREALGGPRQPKPFKRRPLPADPTSNDSSPIRPPLLEHAHSSPLPQTQPRGPQPLHRPSAHSLHQSQQAYGHAPSPSQPYDDTPVPGSGYQNYQNEHDPPTFGNEPQQYHSNRDELYLPPAGYDGREDGRMHMQPNGQSGYNEYSSQGSSQGPYQGLELPELPPHTPRNNRTTTHQSPKYYSPTNSSPVYTLPQYHSMPDMNHPESENSKYQEPSPTRNDRYQETSLQHPQYQSQHRSFDEYSSHPISPPQPTVEDEDEGPPPPPPVHRSSVSSTREIPEHHQSYVPQPLNLRHPRTSISASPLSQNFTTMPQADYSPSYPPSDVRPVSRSAPLDQDTFNQPRRHSSRGSEMFGHQDSYGQPQPQHQMVMHGYDHSRQEPASGRREHRMSSYTPQTYNSTPPQHGTQEPRYENFRGPYDADMPRPLSHHGMNTRQHRSSAPIIKPRAVSPDPRVPMRKSVSPRPEPSSSEPELSSIPFSPDSYEQLNPNLKAASSINAPGPKYNTPEGIRQAAEDRIKEQKLENGPIIGSNGRVIDPSDHLPTDTWAPEPERKVPRKTHEIKLRFKHSPQGAQPMPASAPRAPRESPTRPYSMAASTPPHQAYVSEENSPTYGGRNRLQKKTRGAPNSYNSSYNSSPVLPHNNNTPPSTYPLREHHGYGYNSSPSYPRNSPSGPPIPAKVPLSDQHEWNSHSPSHAHGHGHSHDSSLSDELSRIDIGSARGSKPRSTRYGR